MSIPHLPEELAKAKDPISVVTQFGKVTGGRTPNGAAVFLEIPYALPPARFEDPIALPNSFRYEEKEYIYETKYAAQPMNDGQAEGSDTRDKLGDGKPTENPLFLNIIVPPSFPEKNGFPVNVYIHGGFLQFGSPHSIGSPTHAIVAESEEIYVNLAYRLSAFGFLASDQPAIPGNFGFKDQWTALEWVRDNISAFGGNPDDVRVSGLSAGAHSVHQLLHHVARLPPGVNSPFQRACLQSNAIVSNPKTPQELRTQYRDLLQCLGIDPEHENSLAKLKDPGVTPWERITYEIETNLVKSGTFRATSDGLFLPSASPHGEMEFQASPEFSQALKEKGVRGIIVGDLSEEWYLYSIAHPIESIEDIEPNLKRYYSDQMVEKLMKTYERLPSDAGPQECAKLYGRILSDCQVHLPVRLLHKDLKKYGFPVLRYHIQWTPPQVRSENYVTHGSDRVIWSFLTNVLTPDQVPIARAWLKAVDVEVKAVEIGHGQNSNHDVDDMLTLKTDCTIGWTKDDRWKELEYIGEVLSG